MPEKIYIVGHKNPDTDTVCSAIAYADLKRQLGFDAVPVRAGELNEETKFALNRFRFHEPALIDTLANKKVILVDHNEKTQSPEGIDEAEILEVIDHHKINFSYNHPIPFMTKPYGSTATLIYERFQSSPSVVIKKETAGLLLCAILSDTIVMRGPTTTDIDRNVAAKLADMAQIHQVDEFGIELKKQKSSLKGKNPVDIINSDLKEFDLNGKKVAIGQIEIVDNLDFKEHREELLEGLRKMRNEKDYDLLALMVTNIIEMGTEFLCVGLIDYVKNAFQAEVMDDSVYLPRMVSRKKDIIPPLEKAFQEVI